MRVLQLSAEWILSIFYIAVFDYLVFVVSPDACNTALLDM
jgi:hypothetical protein